MHCERADFLRHRRPRVKVHASESSTREREREEEEGGTKKRPIERERDTAAIIPIFHRPPASPRENGTRAKCRRASKSQLKTKDMSLYLRLLRQPTDWTR